MPEEPELRPRKRSVNIGPFQVTRKPPSIGGDYFHVKTAAFIGLAFVVIHDGVYRQTQPKGEGDFEVWGTISHAGLDMLGVVAGIVIALLLVETGRIR